MCIYSSDVLLPQGMWPKRWPWRKSLSLPLSKHSLFAVSSPSSSSTSPTHMYSSTLSLHFPSGLSLLFGLTVLLTYTFFTNSSHFALNLSKPPQFISFHPFHYSTLHSICISSCSTSYIHVLVSLVIPSRHTLCPSQVTHFHFS